MADSAPASPGAPPLARLLVRLAFLLLLSAYFFFAFALARSLLGGWGLPLRIWLPAAAAAALMSVFVIWLAPLLALPEIWWLHVLPERRARRGLCPDCGQARSQPAAAEPFRCPECGGGGELRPPWQCTWSIIRRFLGLLAIAFLVGSFCAALWCVADEAGFEREVARRGEVSFERPRAWPADFTRLHYEPGRGFASSAFVDSEHIIRP